MIASSQINVKKNPAYTSYQAFRGNTFKLRRERSSLQTGQDSVVGGNF